MFSSQTPMHKISKSLEVLNNDAFKFVSAFRERKKLKE
jgi:hypothetical protein